MTANLLDKSLKAEHLKRTFESLTVLSSESYRAYFAHTFLSFTPNHQFVAHFIGHSPWLNVSTTLQTFELIIEFVKDEKEIYFIKYF